MDRFEVSTLVYRHPEAVYEFVRNFTSYADYSEYIADVTRRGDGTQGTRYDITLRWWKLSYTLRPTITGLTPPERIDWHTTDRVRAQGFWHIDHVPEEAPTDAETASRARLRIDFDPSTITGDLFRLPPLVSMGWVTRRVKPLVEPEANAVFRRAIADLEGEPRPVELTVHERPSSL